MKNIAFIVNPINGIKTKNKITKLVRELLNKDLFSPTVVLIEYNGHATQLAQQFALEGYYAVIAVGGDETVNQVAAGLKNTDTALGIIPIGDDNTLAKHLDISTRMNRAIEMLNHSEPISIDYATLNHTPFFATLKLGSYPQPNPDNLSQYHVEKYHLIGNDTNITTQALAIHINNASPCTDHTYITTKTSVQDGYIDLTIITPEPIPSYAQLTPTVFTNADNTLYINIFKVKQLTILQESTNQTAILDGTTISTTQELHIDTIEDGLKVLVKKRF
jgi:diacylglycerol kinase family enzyme